MSDCSKSSLSASWRDRIINGLAIFYLTSCIVMIGVHFGVETIPRRSHPNQNEPGFVNAFGSWDGVWYSRIVDDGYFYNTSKPSSVAFFPLYPLLGTAASAVFGLSANSALLLVSNTALIGLFVLTGAYVNERYPGSPENLSTCVLLALGLWPTTFFLRMTYTESLFMLLLVTSLWGMHRQWPLFWLAMIVGLTTACRTTGVAMVPALLLYMWQQRTTIKRFVLQSLAVLPVSVWGLLSYMVYLHVKFGDALVFVKTQQHWVTRNPAGLGEYVWALVTLEPIWSKYDSGSVAYWARFDHDISPLFSWHFANPIYFLLALVLIGIGYWKRWLNGPELVLSICLLAVPYLTHSYRAVMMGNARFASAVFPAYLVIGQLLSRAASTELFVVLTVSGLLLGLYSALFASWHPFF